MLALFVLERLVAGHGSMVIPPPRNRIDSDVAPWANSTGPAGRQDWQGNRGIAKGMCFGPGADANTVAATQACFWFAAGCAIGCKTCNGHSRGPLPYTPCTPGDGGEQCAAKMPLCADGIKQPRLPKAARTVNTDVEDGAPNDYCEDLRPAPPVSSAGMPPPRSLW